MFPRRRFHLLVPVRWPIVALFSMVAAPAIADDMESPAKLPRHATLYVQIERGDQMYVMLSTTFALTPPLSPPSEGGDKGGVEDSLSRVVGTSLQAQTPPYGGQYFRYVCTPPYPRDGLRVAADFELAPLVELLRAQKTKQLTVTILHPRVGYSRANPAPQAPTPQDDDDPLNWDPMSGGGFLFMLPNAVHYSYHFNLERDAPSEPIHLEFGYAAQDLLARLGVLAAALLLPIGVTLWKQRAVLRAADAGPAAFGLWLFLRGAIFATWIGWLVVLSLPWIGNLIDFALFGVPHVGRMMVTTALFLAPPAAVTAFCNVLSLSAYTRLRGLDWARGEMIRQAVGGVAALFVPLLFLVIAVGALMTSTRLAIALALAALVSRLLLVRLVGKQERTPYALTVGELRDRIFELAKLAGVKVDQVYIVPSARWREANAFAVYGGQVLLTDYLVQHLSPAEVEAVVAHELGHLKLGHAGALFGHFVVAFAILVLLSSQTMPLLQLMWLSIPVLPLGLAGGFLYAFYQTRRYEFAADEQAVWLTGNPQAVISALAKINRLNLLPMQWDHWQEQLLTHPSTERRLEAIAQKNGISRRQLQEILDRPADVPLPADATTQTVPTAPPSSTPLPVLPESDERVFSTKFKSEYGAFLGWTLLGVAAVLPALVVWLIEATPSQGVARAGLYAAGTIAIVAAYFISLNVLPAGGLSRLRAPLADKLRASPPLEGGDKGGVGIPVEDWGGIFIGFSPDSVPRAYERFLNWDLGFLFLQGDRLCYVGEQTRFALRREQIRSIHLGVGAPGWWYPPALYVTWQEEAGKGGTFLLRTIGERSLRQLGVQARELDRRLQEWLRRSDAPAEIPPPLAELTPPDVGSVTSAWLTDFAYGRDLVRGSIMLLLAAAGTSFLLGLSFSLDAEGTAWFALLGTSVLSLLGWLPYWLYREPMAS